MSDDEEVPIEDLPHPLEQRVEELLDEAQAISDLEKRIDALEAELNKEKQQNSSAINQLCDQETKVKNLLIQSKEDCLKQRETIRQLSVLQAEAQKYKTRVDAAREVAAEHFLNYKKVQQQLDELKKAGFVPSCSEGEADQGPKEN